MEFMRFLWGAEGGGVVVLWIYFNLGRALCRESAIVPLSESVYIQGWAESRHMMDLNVERHKRATE